MNRPATSASAPAAGVINLIGALLEQRTGQQLSANRVWRIETTLNGLLRERGLPDFDALAAALVGKRDAALADAVVEALLNQETSFFRDPGVLEHVAQAVRHQQAASPERSVRIWSAGCSTGQEPLSLAMVFADQPGKPMPEIHASDVSSAALDRARSGRYNQFEAQRGLPIRRLVQWFDPAGQDWAAKPDLLRHVRYRKQNLAGDPPLPGRFDVILCRNVLLYFSMATRRRVLDTLATALRPGGLIVLGAGETVIGQTDLLVPCRDWRGFYTTMPLAMERRRA